MSPYIKDPREDRECVPLEERDVVVADAIRYALTRSQTDTDFRYHMVATETFARLVRAEAAILQLPVADVYRARERDLRAPHRLAEEPREAVLQDRIDELEREIAALRGRDPLLAILGSPS